MEIAYAEALRLSPGNSYRRTTVNPPNRLETSNFELIWELRRAWSTTTLEELRSELKRITGAKHVIFAPSARCALAQILSVLPEREVVMPAYTCPVVKTAVEFAGKKVCYIDISRKTLNATSAEFAPQAQNGRILLPTHLFGIPTDIENITELAQRRGCITIEDAAAALGTSRNGRPLGTFADAGVFSFERSKRFPAFRGAAILINNDRLIDPKRLLANPVVPTRFRFPTKEFVFAQMYNATTQPWIYGRMVLPSLLERYARNDGAERESDPNDSPFYQMEVHPYQAALVLRSLSLADQIRKQIECLVLEYESALSGKPVQTFISRDTDRGGLLRFPIAIEGISRAQFLRRALSQGLYLETNYERPLAPREEWERLPNALWAAENVVLLPLYRSLKQSQARSIAQKVAKIAEEAIAVSALSGEREYATHVG